jgi:hypothetical protein
VALAAAWRGQRPGPTGIAVVLALAALALPANIWLLRERGRELRGLSDGVVATLAVIEAEQATVPPGLQAGFRVPVPARLYLDGVAEFGSPVADRDSIETLPAAAREDADETLGAALAPSLELLPPNVKLSCVAPADPSLVVLENGDQAVIRSPTGGNVLVGRYAQAPTIPAGTLPPDSAARVNPTPVSGPWTARLEGGQLELCRPEMRLTPLAP